MKYISIVAIAFMAATTASGVKQVDDKSLLNAKTDTSLPDGDYADSCQSCSLVDSANTDTKSTLTCRCYNAQGSLDEATYLQNSWSCNGCIANENGALSCQLPPSSAYLGYKSTCTGCGLSSGSLFCFTCDGVTPSVPYVLADACDCASVSFYDNHLACIGTPTPAPTGTKSPTPNAAPATCESYWLTLSSTGEYAPYKACEGGAFSNSNGCQYQNYCCWQPTSSSSGTCKVPKGVPVDCPTLGEGDCLDYDTYCFWNPNYGTSGLCQRRCPGNPQTMCALG